jgi:hypothetical protein
VRVMHTFTFLTFGFILGRLIVRNDNKTVQATGWS